MINAEQIQERKAMPLENEQDNRPCQWWMSFCDPERQDGQQFLGVCIIEAPDLIQAMQKAWALGINPGGEIKALQVSGVSAEYLDKLLSRAEIEASGLV